MIPQSQIIRRLHKSYQLASESAGFKNCHHSSSGSAGFRNIVSESDWIRVNSVTRVSSFDWLYLTKESGWARNFSATQYPAIKCINLRMHIFPRLESATFIWFSFELVPLFQVYATICQRIFFLFYPTTRFSKLFRNFKKMVLSNELIKVELPP